jgi:hypothetical protein
MPAARTGSGPGPGSSRRRSVDAADAAHRCRQHGQHRSRDRPRRAAGLCAAGGLGQGQPGAEREQDGGHHQVEGHAGRAAARSGDDPGHGPGDERQGQSPAGLARRQYWYRAPGVATTLCSRLVGVTCGLDVPSPLTWNGNSSTAPDTPAGVATVAMPYAAASATTSGQPFPSTQSPYKTATRDYPPGHDGKSR